MTPATAIPRRWAALARSSRRSRETRRDDEAARGVGWRRYLNVPVIFRTIETFWLTSHDEPPVDLFGIEVVVHRHRNPLLLQRRPRAYVATYARDTQRADEQTPFVSS